MTGTASMRFAAVIAMIAVIAILAGTPVTAETQIHRCLLDDGTVAFQEMPCNDPAPDADAASKAGQSRSAEYAPDEDANSEFASPFDEPAEPVMPSKPTMPPPVSQSRAECEKATRDAIDAIDLEMKENDYSEEQGQAYLTELLGLTARLRACKQL